MAVSGGASISTRCPTLAADPPGDLLDLDEAVDHLVRKDPLCGQLVKLRCYAGLSVEEAGEALGLSRAEAYRQWTFAGPGSARDSTATSGRRAGIGLE